MARKSFWFDSRDEENSYVCPQCDGGGCQHCRGWGYHSRENACELPATGHECGDCPNRAACRK